MRKKGKKKRMSVEEVEEKSHKILCFIEDLVNDKEGGVSVGETMKLLGGTIHLLLKDVEEDLGKEYAKEVRSDLVIGVILS